MGVELVVDECGTAVWVGRCLPLDGAHELRRVDMGDEEFALMNIKPVGDSDHLMTIGAVGKPLEVERCGANDAMLRCASPLVWREQVVNHRSQLTW
jgi:hypothetical protein